MKHSDSILFGFNGFTPSISFHLFLDKHGAFVNSHSRTKGTVQSTFCDLKTFTVTELNKILSSQQPCQVVKRNHLCSHQTSPTYTCLERVLRAGWHQVMLCLTLLYHWCFTGLFKQVCHMSWPPREACGGKTQYQNG